MYQFIRSILFLFPAESVHHFSMNVFRWLCAPAFLRRIIARRFAATNNPGTTAWGLHFRNPVGLAAGFDKNALYLNELETLGFGSVEIGTVTPRPQPGNEKPRLFRLPKDKALINRMGFNNDGVKVVADRLRKWRAQRRWGKASGRAASSLIIGGNIGKNKSTPNEEAWKDYDACFRELFDCVDYFVVNVSSPNTPGLRELQEKDSLRRILSHLQTINLQKEQTGATPRPILLKIAPDLTTGQIDDVIDLALEIGLDGLVATNTTITRDNLETGTGQLQAIGNGGLSGRPLTQRSTSIIQYITQKAKGKLPVIASGGIFTAADASEKLEAGASLVQVWTGFIYEGPAIAKKICSGLG